MRKVIAAINMTLDGFCDHTAIIPDEEIHNHYADLLSEADIVLYGRITYQLMEFWRRLAENPSQLFENLNDRTVLKLMKTKAFSGGPIILYYEPTNERTITR